MSRKKRIAEIHQLLRDRRDEVRRLLAGEVSRLGTDEDAESLDDEAYIQTATAEGRELDRLNAAIGRIQTGSYGLCESCQEEIPLPRLLALPCADFCIHCQQLLEIAGSPSVGRLP